MAEIKPKFVSMAELSCSPLIQLIFNGYNGSKDRLMDILKKGAPSPGAGKCQGDHHPACDSVYGCVGERRLLLPTPFLTWIGEAEQHMGIMITEKKGSYGIEATGAINKLAL